jgi:hypothetical protein
MESRTPDFDGRRLVRVDGGYVALNFAKYREKDHTAAERSKRYREKLAASRPKGKTQRAVRSEHAGREARFVKADEEGDTKRADQIAAEGL